MIQTPISFGNNVGWLIGKTCTVDAQETPTCVQSIWSCFTHDKVRCPWHKPWATSHVDFDSVLDGHLPHSLWWHSHNGICATQKSGMCLGYKKLPLHTYICTHKKHACKPNIQTNTTGTETHEIPTRIAPTLLGDVWVRGTKWRHNHTTLALYQTILFISCHHICKLSKYLSHKSSTFTSHTSTTHIHFPPQRQTHTSIPMLAPPPYQC